MYKLAIVDDEQEILTLLKNFLSRREYFEIDTYTDPETALSSLLNSNYDIIISDIMMPKIDGIQLLNMIKEKKSNQKVMLMTAFSTEQRIIDADFHGADDYLTKPFISLRDVENKILDLLNVNH